MASWHQKTAKQALKELDVAQEVGLSAAQASKRLQKYGLNKLDRGRRFNALRLLAAQFKDILIVILLVAAAVSFVVGYVEGHGRYTESVLIFVIVLAIAVIGFFNEYKAEKTVEALSELMSQRAKVRRGGEIVEIDATELAPGDIVLLEEGQKIAADLRLLQVNELRVNEASLTGESVPTGKNALTLSGEKALGDQKNMAFSGTIVVSGNGEGVVVATAELTELGKIAGLVEDVHDDETPLQKKLDSLGKKIGALVLGISLIVFVAIFFFDQDFIDETLAQRLILSFTAAVALAVAAIPEGLAFVVRISLAIGARRMATKNALARRLSAVEALGSTDVICSDKTGTLTKGEMTVTDLYVYGHNFTLSGAGYQTDGELREVGKQSKHKKYLELLMRIGLINNNANLDGGKVLGDPTEGALIVSAAKLDMLADSERRDFPRLAEFPFSSARKRMSTAHRAGRDYLVAAKGAPDVLLELCDRILVDGKTHKLTAEMRREVLATNDAMTKRALRVLGFAYKQTKTQPKTVASAEDKLVFAGLQGMIDPPREEVKRVMHTIHSEAGMRVVMVTGDHIETAKAVAEMIGIQGEAISGTELAELSQAELEERIESIGIYARVDPAHKIRIVSALQARGHQVAMTGDGVNDSPAIKAADIGIAMGINGTDATKEVADLVLLDDQFLTIIDAVEEGRGIFDNVRKFVNYLLSANIAEVITILGGVIWLNTLVLSAPQLLFINIVTDGLPAVALGSDPAERGIMRFKPRHFQGAIINKRVWLDMFIFGLLMSTALLAHFWWLHNQIGGTTRAVSVAFVGMVIYELMRLVGIRSDYKIRWFSNPWLSVAIAGSIALTLAVIYFEPLAAIFGVAPIMAIDWLIIGLVSVFLVFAMKLIDRLLDATYIDSRSGDPAKQQT